MRIAVQGCSHGSLSVIYDTVAQYTANTSSPVDLLLLCGDFQALRSAHDFASLAVPAKYHALGTFHQYYSGERKAPLLTIVIGGNHEASNYMWELYHGGWLAENIYYLGAAGSVCVNGLRIAGASGIYKDHDYHKGHFEKVPYNNSTLRSVYHIRQYDVAKLMQLSPKSDSIFLSHDWPISIAKHGDTGALLRRKPFFRDEVNSNTLGSPPLLNLLNHLQPAYWFAAHLHVKFAAIFDHSHSHVDGTFQAGQATGRASIASAAPVPAGPTHNPDEIEIDDDEEFDGPSENTTQPVVPTENPDEIVMDDDEFDEPAAGPSGTKTTAAEPDDETGPAEISTVAVDLAVDESADLVEEARKEGDEAAAAGVISAPADQAAQAVQAVEKSPTEGGAEPRSTKFLALDKCGPGKDFIQFIEVDAPIRSTPGQAPRLTFDPEWLAICRALHPYLSTTLHQTSLPPPQILNQLVADEIVRIREEGLLVPSEEMVDGQVQLVWEKGEVEVGRVQKFWPTAPAHGEPGGSPSNWYTNPQTEAFCGMLGVENKVNPAPR
ncbi:hypothetical protein IAU60_004409 [Kwoniella sp. DSM 27419]